MDSEGNKWGGIMLFSLGDMEQLCIVYGMHGWAEAAEMFRFLVMKLTCPPIRLHPNMQWLQPSNGPRWQVHQLDRPDAGGRP